MPYTEDEWSKIAGSKSEFISAEQARELLSDIRVNGARIYGLDSVSGQIVRVPTLAWLGVYDCERLWIANTTISDLTGKA